MSVSNLNTDKPILDVSQLQVSFNIKNKWINAVDGCSFSVNKGKTLGIVGESGCGKSVTSLAIMRLISSPSGRISSGKILFDDLDLTQISEANMRKIRGNRISMIFQEPMTSLNPVFSIGDQIAEVFKLHKGCNNKEAFDRSIDMLKQVRIPSPERRVNDFPHQLSGGMRQRVMIAMALACKPTLLIADEPTTALDVTIQAQILALINNLQESQGMSTLLITHDLGVVAESCDDVVVMYGGKIMESGSVKEIFSNPSHPYTKGLLASIPKLGEHRKRLETIPGMVPTIGNFLPGCRFQERCTKVTEDCKKQTPALKELSPMHHVACINLKTI